MNATKVLFSEVVYDFHALFRIAIDLEIGHKNGLLQRTFLSKNQKKLEWDKSPRWHDSLRPCRSVLDLTQKQDCERAEQLGSAIMAANPEFDLFAKP
jgi:hypothetical protein